jgi:hypothetical protein
VAVCRVVDLLPSTDAVFAPRGKYQAAHSTVLGTVELLLAWHLVDERQLLSRLLWARMWLWVGGVGDLKCWRRVERRCI